MMRIVRPHPLICVLWLALAVRLTHLTYHSFWFDEAVSALWAGRPAAEIWQVGMALRADKHPPLYYLLLHFWSGLVGGGDFPLRAMGVFLGTFALVPVFGIGRRLGGRWLGLGSALLLALNPFLVWYSQEARMFMPAATFALLGLYGVLRLGEVHATSAAWRVGRQELLAMLLMVVGLLAALYSYLYSAFLLPVAAIWLALQWWQERGQPEAGRRLALGAGGLATVALLFLPLAWSAWQVSGAEAVPGKAFAGMGPALRSMLKAYALGWPRWPATWTSLFTVAFGLLALAGCLVPSARPGRRHMGIFLLAWLGVILLVGGLLLRRDSQVFAESRYHIMMVPALCLAWPRALQWLWSRCRPIGLALVALVLVVTLTALPANWAPENRREAWREVAGFIEAHAGPNDAIVIQADYLHLAFRRYFTGRQPIFFPFTDRLADPAMVEPPLAGLHAFDTVWLVQAHHEDLDPHQLVLSWFAARYPLVTEVYPTGIAIHGFAQRYRLSELPGNVAPLQAPAVFAALRLLACQYQPTQLSPRDDLFHPPSAWIHAVTYWTVHDSRPPESLWPRLRLVDAAGQVWGESLERAGDTFHLWPVSRWLPGEVVRGDHDINLNPVTPPGKYRVIVEVPGSEGQVSCGEVEIR